MPRKKTDAEVKSAITAAPTEITAGAEVVNGAVNGSDLTPIPLPPPPSVDPASLFGDTNAGISTTQAGEPEDEGSDEAVSSLTVPLTASGRVAWKAVKRDSTKDKIRKAMGGVETSLAKHQELEGLTKMAPALWIGVNMISTSLLTRKAPESIKDKLSEALAYSKDELEQLAGPTAAVLQKYVPASLADYSDEINLVMTAGKIHLEKMAEVSRIMQAYQAAEDARKAATPAQPVNAHTPPEPIAEMAPSLSIPTEGETL